MTVSSILLDWANMAAWAFIVGFFPAIRLWHSRTKKN